jgi:outer membrane protein assembly factor BamB
MHVRKTWAAKAPTAIVFLAGFLALALATPRTAEAEWDQAFGDPANTGFVDVPTNLPVAASWAFQLDGPVSFAGPAVSKKGMIWVGTTSGTLWSFQTGGNFHCSHTFDGAIVATPAVLPGDDVVVLVSRPEGELHQTSLARVSANCGLVWRVELPSPHGFPSHTSAAVKVWGLNGASFLFVHTVSTAAWDEEVADGEGQSLNEVIVYDESGEIFARRRTGNQCLDVSGGGGFDDWGDLWDFLTGWWPSAGETPPLYKSYGWPDSTPAILDAEIRGISTPARPAVVVTEHNCAIVSLDVLQFLPDATTFEERLVKKWRRTVTSPGTLLSSPAVTREGQIAFGTSDHRLLVFDIASQEWLWHYNTKSPVMEPPVMTPGLWIARSDYMTQFLTPLGDEVPTARPQPFPSGGGVGAMAASRTEVVVPSFQELGFWTHDLLDLTHALTNWRFPTSSPALTADGRVYVVAQTDEKAVLIGFD